MKWNLPHQEEKKKNGECWRMKERADAYIKVEWKYRSLLMVVGDGTMITKLVVLSILSQCLKC